MWKKRYLIEGSKKGSFEHVWGRGSIRFPRGKMLAVKLEREERTSNCWGLWCRPPCAKYLYIPYLILF